MCASFACGPRSRRVLVPKGRGEAHTQGDQSRPSFGEPAEGPCGSVRQVGRQPGGIHQPRGTQRSRVGRRPGHLRVKIQVIRLGAALGKPRRGTSPRRQVDENLPSGGAPSPRFRE